MKGALRGSRHCGWTRHSEAPSDAVSLSQMSRRSGDACCPSCAHTVVIASQWSVLGEWRSIYVCGSQYSSCSGGAWQNCVPPPPPQSLPFCPCRALLTQVDGLLQRHQQQQLLVEAAGALVYASKAGPEALQVRIGWLTRPRSPDW